MLKGIKSLFKDYSSDFYLWSQEIAIDTNLDEVKRQLPSYVTVDWQSPESLGKGLLYPVTMIKGRKLKQRWFLGFVDGAYSGCIIMGT
jgi:hypothetical protein